MIDRAHLLIVLEQAVQFLGRNANPCVLDAEEDAMGCGGCRHAQCDAALIGKADGIGH